MQLGARWRVGDPPHSSLPPALHDEVARQEGLHPDADSWTLTWLEGRPRAALDDVVVVSLGTDGVVASGGLGAVPDDDDDWLS